MRIVDPRPMVATAMANSYGIPAFNTNGGTYDITRAALESAQELRSPIILQAYERNCGYRGFGYIVTLIQSLIADLDITVPVAIQLDHGHTLSSIVSTLQAGFTGVMYDASHLGIETNISETQKIVEISHSVGVAVEGEIGYVAGNEVSGINPIGRIAIPETPTIPAGKTDPTEAAHYASESGIDMLAVSIGTTHGVYKKQDDLDFTLLDEIRRRTDLPLVQHGTSGVSYENLRELIRRGMTKINFGEPFRQKYVEYYYDFADSTSHQWHAWRVMEEVKNALKNDMIELIQILGSDGKAR